MRILIKILSILQIWCRRVTALYDNVNILDMDQSWRDGIAFCALIDHFRPGLLGRSVASLESSDVLDNNELAFRVAEEELGIPSLLDPQVRIRKEKDTLNYYIHLCKH